jgi:hypothetical protein
VAVSLGSGRVPVYLLGRMHLPEPSDVIARLLLLIGRLNLCCRVRMGVFAFLFAGRVPESLSTQDANSSSNSTSSVELNID